MQWAMLHAQKDISDDTEASQGVCSQASPSRWDDPGCLRRPRRQHRSSDPGRIHQQSHRPL